MSKDDLGDRMKEFEAAETDRRLGAFGRPVYARIDGRGFSRFTRGLERPYDARLSRAMIDATKHLVDHTSAKIGFTQSDEISLVWRCDGDNPLQEMFFAGKIQKLVSVLASLATAAFTRAVLASDDPEFRAYVDRMPHFDARVFELPSPDEAANAFLWREQDAARNAISMVAQSLYSHKELQGKSTRDMLRMTAEAGVDFDLYPDFFKRGTFVRRALVERRMSVDEWSRIPEGKRPPPDQLLIRSTLLELNMPPFREVANRPAVIFEGADPEWTPAALRGPHEIPLTIT